MSYWRLASLLLIICLLCAVLSLSCERSDEDDNDTGSGYPENNTVLKSFPNLSGLTWMNDDHLVAVHDAKNKFEKKKDPRISVLSLSSNLDVTLTRVKMNWGDEQVSDDLESVCALSLEDGDFLAAESGQDGEPFVRIFRLKITEQNKGWNGEVVDVFSLPDDTVNVEGIECLARDDQKATILLGERGGSHECPDGKLRLCEIDFASGQVTMLEEIVISIDNINWTNPGRHRDISDLYLDPTGTLWGVATEDPADAGPWRSAIYKAGTVSGSEVTIDDNPEIAAEVVGLKIESLAGPIVDASRFSLGTDDESYGGIWRPVP